MWENIVRENGVFLNLIAIRDKGMKIFWMVVSDTDNWGENREVNFRNVAHNQFICFAVNGTNISPAGFFLNILNTNWWHFHNFNEKLQMIILYPNKPKLATLESWLKWWFYLIRFGWGGINGDPTINISSCNLHNFKGWWSTTDLPRWWSTTVRSWR